MPDFPSGGLDLVQHLNLDGIFLEQKVGFIYVLGFWVCFCKLAACIRVVCVRVVKQLRASNMRASGWWIAASGEGACAEQNGHQAWLQMHQAQCPPAFLPATAHAGAATDTMSCSTCCWDPI